MHIDVITVPYRYDEAHEGLGLGPQSLLDAGLIDRLSGSITVSDAVQAVLDPAEREEGRTAVNIGKLGASTAKLVAAARAAEHGALVLAGDDTATVGVAAGLQQAEGPGAAIGIVYVDAHGDFNTPETSYSGILAGMPLAILAGLAGPLWRGAAGLLAPIPTDRILLAGVRELDEKEESLLRSTAVRVVGAAELRAGERFVEAVDRLASHCSMLLLHVDLDVLDPHLVPSASTPSAGGLEISEAASAMAAVLRTGKVAAVCVSSLNPGGGTRGQRSIQSATDLLEHAIPKWSGVPAHRP